MDKKSLIQFDLFKFQILGLSYGGILILILYNFFLFIAIKEKIYIYYVFYVSTFALWQMIYEGYIPFTKLTGDMLYIISGNTLSLFFIFLILFSRELLSTRRYMPKLDKLLYMSIWAISFSFLLNFYDPILLISTMNMLGIIVLSLLFWIAIKSYYLGNKIAVFYLYAQVVFLVMMLPFLLMSINILPFNFYIKYAPLVGSVYEIVVFSLALAYRIKVLKDEKIQVEVLAKEGLECEVEERTKKLKVTQSKLNALNLKLESRVDQEINKNQKNQKILAQQARLASMGEMLSSIAHQWRQPLNRINSNVAVLKSALRRDIINSEILTEQTEMIEKNTKYMSNTIEDFANFFHPGKIETEFFLQNVIDKALDLIDICTKNIEINIVLEKELKLFSFEKEYLQVILIILNNAIDNFETKAIKEPKIDIVIKRYEGMVTLAICDNGGGVSEENIDRIFDPYFSTKFAKEGTGLGLYVAKMMIENSMHGRLQVKNKNGGACFEISTPLRKNGCMI